MPQRVEWAIEKASSMKIEDLPERIGGTLISVNDKAALELPYFNESVVISDDDIVRHPSRN